MSEQINWVTVLVNRALGKAALVILALFHVHPANPEYPIPVYVATELLIFVIAIGFFAWFRRRISVESPGPLQQCLEGLLTNPMGVGVRDLLEDSVGHGAEKYLAMLGSIGMFVLLCNLISAIPTLASPTADPSVPLGCAIVVFLYYNWCGLRHHGPLGYTKHFMGPVWWLSWLMLPIEIVSNVARLLSLTVRLWVNMMVSDLLYILFLGLTIALFLFLGKSSPVGYVSGVGPVIAAIFILLHIFVAFLQAFVFVILPVIYVAGVVGEEH